MNKLLLENFLITLGLSSDESLLFTFLIQKGPSTILSLSRLTSINRTKIYRLVERLQKIGLLQEIIEENKTFLKAADLKHLESLVFRQEEKAKHLRSVLPQIMSLIPPATSLSQPSTKVVFYRGVEGIKQMVWNTLQTKGELVGYSYRRLDEIVGVKFANEWHDEWIARNLKMRDVYSNDYLESLKKQKHFHYSDKHFLSKYIAEKILNINHQVDIYNDVVGYYNWFEGEIFGVEIYNNKIATMQRQLFEIVWKMGKIPKKS